MCDEIMHEMIYKTTAIRLLYNTVIVFFLKHESAYQNGKKPTDFFPQGYF